MDSQVGDVLVVLFFAHKENNNEGEPRWVIVVEDLGDEFLLIGLTKQLRQLSKYPDGFIVYENSTDGKQMGLEYDSIICCGESGVRKEQIAKKKILKIPPIIKKGTCPENLLEKIISLCP
jgi:hypothetical protein